MVCVYWYLTVLASRFLMDTLFGECTDIITAKKLLRLKCLSNNTTRLFIEYFFNLSETYINVTRVPHKFDRWEKKFVTYGTYSTLIGLEYPTSLFSSRRVSNVNSNIL